MSKNNDLNIVNGYNLDELISYIRKMIIKKGIATYDHVHSMTNQELFQYVVVLILTEKEYQKLKAISNYVKDEYEEFKN